MQKIKFLILCLILCTIACCKSFSAKSQINSPTKVTKKATKLNFDLEKIHNIELKFCSFDNKSKKYMIFSHVMTEGELLTIKKEKSEFAVYYKKNRVALVRSGKELINKILDLPKYTKWCYNKNNKQWKFRNKEKATYTIQKNKSGYAIRKILRHTSGVGGVVIIVKLN